MRRDDRTPAPRWLWRRPRSEVLRYGQGVTPDEEGFDEDPEAPVGSLHPLLPPDDRTWRHPSEVAAQARADDRRRKIASAHRWSWHRWAATALMAALVAFVGVTTLADGSDSRPQVGFDGTVADTAVGFGADELLSGPAVTIEIYTSSDRLLASATVYRDQYLLTAARLVTEAHSISVLSTAGGSIAASVIGSDAHTDLAVLRLDNPMDGAPPVRRSPLRIGMALTAAASSRPAEALAPATITAVDRRERTPEGTDLYGLARIDLLLGSEMTGGALLDRSGRLVGVLNAMAFEDSPSRDGSTVVLPAAIAANVADAIIETGTARHAWLGLAISDPPRDDSDPCPTGVAVTAVRPESPAERAGIRPGDFVVGVGRRDTPTITAVMTALRLLKPGDATDVEVCSAGMATTRPVVVAESPVGE